MNQTITFFEFWLMTASAMMLICSFTAGVMAMRRDSGDILTFACVLLLLSAVLALWVTK